MSAHLLDYLPKPLKDWAQRLHRSEAAMSWSLADQVVGSAQNFLVGVAVARLSGITEFGTFTLVFVAAMLAYVAQDLFLGYPMLTFSGGRKRRTQPYFKAVVVWSLAVAMAAGLAIAACVFLIQWAQNETAPLRLLLGAVALTAANNHFATVKRVAFALGRGSTGFALGLARAGLLAVAAVAASLSGWHLDAATWFCLMGFAAAAAALPLTLKFLTSGRTRPRLQLALMTRHWIYARWLLLMVLCSLGQEQLIWVWLGIIEGDAAVGAMRAGHYLLGTTHVVLMGMHNFIAREAAIAFAEGGHDGLTHYLTQRTIILGVLIGVLLLTLALFAEFWMRVAFGSAYVAYAGTLRFYCVIYGVIFLREVWMIYLRTLEMTRPIFVSFAVSSAVAFMIAYPAIKTWGITGALTVVLIANIICGVLVAVAVHRARSAGLLAASGSVG